MQLMRLYSRQAYTLIELSLVILVLSLLAAASLRYVNSTNDTKAIAATNANLDVVEAALMNYRNTYGQLPCPADITLAENTTGFGTQADASGDGNCTVNYINSSTDPDGPGGSDPGATDPNYDSATISQVVEGAIPTKTLKLADKYAYDYWGNKIFYAVDKRITANAAFTTYGPTSSIIGAVVVKYTGTSTLVTGPTFKGLYALISTGKNGHGGYVRNLSATSVPGNAGSSTPDELVNCHCSSSAVSTLFTRIFVQKTPITSLSSSTYFDDIVRFKTRSDMASPAELK